jgi:hypothetical protein
MALVPEARALQAANCVRRAYRGGGAGECLERRSAPASKATLGSLMARPGRFAAARQPWQDPGYCGPRFGNEDAGRRCQGMSPQPTSRHIALQQRPELPTARSRACADQAAAWSCWTTHGSVSGEASHLAACPLFHGSRREGATDQDAGRSSKRLIARALSDGVWQKVVSRRTERLAVHDPGRKHRLAHVSQLADPSAACSEPSQ